MEEESQGYQDDVDKIMDTFRQRETEWKSEMEALQNKNNIISSLLSLMQGANSISPNRFDVLSKFYLPLAKKLLNSALFLVFS